MRSDLKHIIRWIYASTTKHFSDLSDGVTLFFEGEEKLKENNEYAEYSMLDLQMMEHDRNVFTGKWMNQILISVAAGNKNKYRIHEIAGIFYVAMENVCVIEYGKGPDDTQVLVDCALTKSPVRFKDFGLIRPDNKLRQMRVLAEYTLDFSLRCKQ